MSDTGIITDEILLLRKRLEDAESRIVELEAQAARLITEHEAALILNESMSSARELVDFDNERFAAAVREWRKQLAAVESAKRGDDERN